jgi:hypoxanthine phosphoribosyltransferase
MENLDVKKLKVLVGQMAIYARVSEFAANINKDYVDKNLVLVGVLKASFIFLSDLVKKLTVDPIIDFIQPSSYTGTTRGAIHLIQDLTIDIKNKDVLLIDTIIDSGHTIDYLTKLLEMREPKSIETMCLLNKMDARQIRVPIKYSGWYIGNEFVIGYGLDLDEKYRNLPDILLVEETK